MTKRKLNNLLNFLIFALPIILLVASAFMKFLNSQGSEDWALSDYLNLFVSGFENIPIFTSILQVICLCFNITMGVVIGNPTILFLVAFIVYLLIATFAIIIKDLLLLLVNIVNKYIFMEE